MSRFLHPRFLHLTPYVPGEQPTGRKWIKLNTNENPYPPGPTVGMAVSETMSSLQLYPEITSESVVKPLAHFLGVNSEQVFVANGSDEVLAFIFWALCPNGAAFADITYGFYEVYSDMYGVDKTVVPLRDDFSIQVQDYQHLNKTIFIANPNAPTGLALTCLEIEQIVSSNKNNLVVVDEAYVAFGAETAVPLLEKYDNLLIVGTFSKARSLAGARLGYAAGSSQLIQDLNRMKFGFNPYNVNTMTLAAARASLEDRAYYESCVERVCKTRDKTTKELELLGFVCTNSLANFLFITHPTYKAEELFLALRDNGILVRWFNKARIENHLRVSVGTEEEMADFVQAMQNIIKNKNDIT